jgi:hypothetical protein
MNFSAFLAALSVLIVDANGQISNNFGVQTPQTFIEAPLKPIDSNTSRVVYPSEDTNMNRKPSHVSNEVRTRSASRNFLISTVQSGKFP